MAYITYFKEIPCENIIMKMKNTYTIAVPKSGCKRIKNTGKNANASILSKTNGLFKFSIFLSMYLASDIIKPTFTNSDGDVYKRQS